MSDTEVTRRAPFGSNPTVGQRGASTHGRILDAALSVFADVGYHDTRVELITEAADCSRPTFYQYFSSKEEVFWKLAGLLGREMVTLAEQLESPTADETGVTSIRNWILEFNKVHTRYAPIFASFNAALRANDALRSGSRDVATWFGEALMRNTGISADDPGARALASSIVTIVSGTHSFWQLLTPEIDEGRYADSLARLVHRIVYGPIEGINVCRPARRSRRRQPLRHFELPEQHGSEGRTLRPQGVRTRAKLLDAGRSVFASLGFHDARVDDIVAEAAVSHGSFYRYFSNREELFAVLATEAALSMLEEIDRLPAEGGVDDVRSWVERWFARYSAQGAIIGAWQELGGADEQTAALGHQVSQTVLDRLERALTPRGFGDLAVDALALLAVIERMPAGVYSMGTTEEEAALEAMTAFIDRGVLGRAVDR